MLDQLDRACRGERSERLAILTDRRQRRTRAASRQAFTTGAAVP
jgi:hypothetical protein